MADEMNEFPEKEQARTEAVTIILNGFQQARAGKQLSRTIWGFWNKAKAQASEDLVKDVENAPDKPETALHLAAFLKEQMGNTRFFLAVLTMVETFKQKG